MTLHKKSAFLGSRLWVVSLLSVLALGSKGWAVDRYGVDVPAYVMQGDPDVVVRVTPLQEEGVDTSPHSVKFVGLPKGVRINGLNGLPTHDVAGPSTFQLLVDSSVTERRVFVQIQNTSDARVRGAAVINVERPVHHFSITPLGATAPRVGVPFPFQIVAFDEAGAVVRSFKGPVSLTVDRGQVSPPEMDGAAFVRGVVSVEVVFSLDDSFKATRFVVRAKNHYGSEQPAEGWVNAVILPEASQ